MAEPAPVAAEQPKPLDTLAPRMLVLRARAAIRDMLDPAGERFSQMHLRDALQALSDAEIDLLAAEDKPEAEEGATAAQ